MPAVVSSTVLPAVRVKGGVKRPRTRYDFGSPVKLPAGGECDRCFYPLKLDVFGKGCPHNCHYCYARSVLDFRDLWRVEAAVASFDSIQRALDGKALAPYVSRRLPVRLGGMTDCFASNPRARLITKNVLWLLSLRQHPHLCFTKSDSIASDFYRPVLNPSLAYIQFTITTDNDALAARMEPNAPPPSARLRAVSDLVARGFRVAVRVNPLFPTHEDGFFTGGSRRHPSRRFDYFNLSLVDRIADSGAQTLIAGMVRLSSWNRRWLEEAGFDCAWLFHPSTRQRNSAFHYSLDEKRHYYSLVSECCRARGVAFSICYDGDEDYLAFRDLWNDPNDCCNAAAQLAAFRGRGFASVNSSFLATPSPSLSFDAQALDSTGAAGVERPQPHDI